jgi:ubiquinone/menaquinone biosynthesis C-methylase UbiE
MNPQNHLEHFESLVPRFDVQRKKQRYYYSLLLNRLKYLVPPNQSILELGCADGEQMMSLKPSSAMGIDFSPGFLRLARERYPQGRWIQADLTQPLPSIPPAFDYVIGTDILGYLQDIQGAMENVANICGPETRLVLTKSNPFWGPLFRLASYVGLAEPRRYSNWLSQKQSADILELAGFEVVQSGKFCLLPIEIPFVSTFFNRFLAHLPLINSLCLVEYLVCRKKPAPRKHIHR